MTKLLIDKEGNKMPISQLSQEDMILLRNSLKLPLAHYLCIQELVIKNDDCILIFDFLGNIRITGNNKVIARANVISADPAFAGYFETGVLKVN